MASSVDFSIYSIPAYYILNLLPHVYAVNIIKSVNNGHWNNASPRSASHMSSLQKSVPAEIFSRHERAQAAHANGLENFPLLIAAVVLGNLAKLDVALLNGVSWGFVVLRILYAIAYVQIVQQKLSLLRSAIYLLSLLLSFYSIVKSGMVLSGET